MKISLCWLNDFITFHPKISLREIVWKITEATAEIEKVHEIGKRLEHVVVGEIVKIKKHPRADHLFIAQVKVSPKEKIQVVYGQKASVQQGDKIPTVIAPSELPGAKVEARTIRGEISEGMLCLDSELLSGASEVLTKFKSSTKVGERVVDLMMLNDTVLEIDNHSITHRPDLFSHLGFARECVALGLAKWKKRKMKTIHPGKKEIPIKIMFEKKGLTKSYHSTVLEGVSTKESPLWMKRRLEAVDIRSINAIVDITNYVMFEVGQPTHAFDLRFVQGKEFLTRVSKKGEKVKTLDGIERTLPNDVIVVESSEKIIDLSGIMGGENSEIKPDTTSIYFHSAHYDNVLIRRAMIALAHRTDGGTIHEKNVEPERSYQGFIRGLELFLEIFPELRLSYEFFSHQFEHSLQKKIQIPFQKIENHLGIDVPLSQMKRTLENLEFKIKTTKTGLEIVPPTFRSLGITIEEDIIEEIARMYGYSNIPALSPQLELMLSPKNNKRLIKKTIQSFLIGHGFQEEVNFSFLSETLLKKIGYSDISHLIELKNPVSDDFRFMRPHFLPYLLHNLSRNQIITREDLRTFEMGSIYKRYDESIVEHHQLALLSSSSHEKAFFQQKGIVQTLFSELNVEYRFETGENPYATSGKCLQISIDDQALGCLYELHPFIKDQFKLENTIILFECNLDYLFEAKSKEIFYKPINRNPEALLDISVLVEKMTPLKEAEQVISSVFPEFLKKIECLEVYEGKNLPEGKKSFTFSLAYQHPERTLDENEIQNILKTLIKKIENSGGIVRR